MFSYTSAPSRSTARGRLDMVRLRLGDTDGSHAILQDEEVEGLLADNGDDVDRVMPDAIDAAVASLNRRVSQRVSHKGSTVDPSKMLDTLMKLRASYVKKLRGAAAPIVGGLTHSGKRELDRDVDAVQPGFRIGRDDYPGRADDTDWYGR